MTCYTYHSPDVQETHKHTPAEDNNLLLELPLLYADKPFVFPSAHSLTVRHQNHKAGHTPTHTMGRDC